MAQPAVTALAAALLLLSGCTSTADPDQAGDSDVETGPQADTPATTTVASKPTVRDRPAAASSEPSKLHLRGHALTPSLHPIANATVTVVGLDQARTTGADGAFDFGPQERRLYTLTAAAPGFEPASLTVTPDQKDAIKLILQPGDPVTPYSTTVHFRGILECAFEALIISPSCDSAVVAAGGPALFRTNQTYLFPAERGWRTLVVDVVFDGEAHPGLDGLRIAVRGSLDPDGGGEYTQYGRWHGSTSFAARLEPGGTYTDGTEAVPGNATGFQVDVYPHSHAYHPGEQGFLGVGFAQNVEFDVYATLFYVEPAPDGWTILGANP